MTEEKKNITKVFVYGTLKKGRRLDRKAFADLRTSVQEATIEGSIFDLGPYPTIKLDGKGLVIGEVHTFPEKHMENVKRVMDSIEGYNSSYPDKGLYNCHKVKATLKDGEVVVAWTYEYNGPVDPECRIKEGVWPA